MIIFKPVNVAWNKLLAPPNNQLFNYETLIISNLTESSKATTRPGEHYKIINI